MDRVGTVGSVEDLTSVRTQGLDVFPYPRGPITDDTKPYLVFRNHARFFDLREGLAEVAFLLSLMPTQQMDDPIAIPQGKAETRGVSPLAAPRRPLGPRPPLTRTALPGALGARRHLGPINPQNHHRTAPPSRCHLGEAPLALVARRHALQHRQALGPLMRQRVPPLTASAHAGEIVKHRLGLVLGHCRHHLGRGLLHIQLFAPWSYAQRRVEGRDATATGRTIAIRPLTLPRAPQGLDRARDVLASLQEPITPRTMGLLSRVFATMGRLDNRLGQAAGAVWAQGPPRLGHFRSGRFRLGELLLQPIEPLVKAGMELLAQSVRLFSCTDLG